MDGYPFVVLDFNHWFNPQNYFSRNMNNKPLAVGLGLGVGMGLVLKSWLLGILFELIKRLKPLRMHFLSPSLLIITQTKNPH